MSFQAEDFKKYEHYIVEEVGENVYHVQFNDPKTLNSFTEKKWRDYQEILEKLDQIEDCAVIIISSTFPKAFSSGINLKEAMELFSDDSGNNEEKYKKLSKFTYDFGHSISTPARISTPTICLVNGICYGLGLDIASTCTIRVATPDCKFSIREIKVGIISDMGTLQRMNIAVGNKSLFNQYALTGCIFSTEDANKLGYISKVVPDLESGVKYCRELAADIASNVNWAIKGTKKSVQQIQDGHFVDDGIKFSIQWNVDNISGVPKL